MVKRLKNILVMVLILTAGLMFLIPGVASAIGELPWLNFTGSFDYTYNHIEQQLVCQSWRDGECKRWKNEDVEVFDYTLTLTNWDITDGKYADNSAFGEGDDPITGAWIEINGTDTLYNGGFPDNLSFDENPGTSTFTITNGSTVFLEATLANFYVDDEPLSPWDMTPTTMLNKYLDDDNIIGVTYGIGTGSDYIDDLAATDAPFNLYWEFSFTSGATSPYGDGTAFTENSGGTFQGTLYAGPTPEPPVIPEPISTVLFITGGATLAFRRYRRGIKN